MILRIAFYVDAIVTVLQGVSSALCNLPDVLEDSND